MSVLGRLLKADFVTQKKLVWKTRADIEVYKSHEIGNLKHVCI